MRKNLRNNPKWIFFFSFFLFFFNAYSQVQNKSSKEVRGTITDSSGAVAGVSIAVKGKQNIGTTTDLNGKFLLNVPEDATLVITMVGYDNQEISVKGKEVINVSLKRATTSLDDVVVVAYGKQKRREVVGSVTSIKPSDLKIPSSNLTTALAGRLAGVIAYQRTGEPGSDNAEFFIRGVTTFGYKKDPLILIDGIEFTTTELARLNPDDIASFSIMKDATANALYGARGANGVILVTTKEGKQGKVKINIRYETSVSSATKEVELADPVTYMKLHNEAYLTRNPLAQLPYLQSKIDNTISGVNPNMFPATDWKHDLLNKSAVNYRANVNVSGGGQIARYYLAGSFSQDNGNLKVDHRNNFNNNINLKTYVLRSNVNLNVTKTTEIVVRLHGSFDDYNGPIDGGTGMYKKIMRTNPVLFPAYYPVDADHAFTNHILFGNSGIGNYLNPYADMVKGYKDYSRSLMLAQVEAKQDLSFLTQGLSARLLMNTNRQSYFDVSRFYNPFYYYGAGWDRISNEYQLVLINQDAVSWGSGNTLPAGTDYLGYSEGTKTVLSNFYFEGAINYNRTFKDKHGLSGLVVFTARNQLEGNAKDLQKSLPYRNLGVSGRATYSYDNRYFAEFNFGYNGSERFYKTERYGFFPSAGIAWAVSNEKFFEKFKPAISKVKLRATYGLVGNDAIGSADDRFFYLSNVNMNNSSYSYNFGTDGLYSRTGISISRYDNKDITWETSNKSNLALELGLFNKLEIIAEVYKEKRYNILMERLIPITMGLQSPSKANVGKASGKGIDISVDYSSNFGKNWIITARGNFTYATSNFDVYEEPQYAEYYKYHVGHPLSQQWGYIAEHLFVDNDEVKNSPPQFGTVGSGTLLAGDIKFRDVNGDGVITSLDQVPIGYPTTPEIIYGFGLSAKYKGIDFSSFFQGSARSSFWIDVAATSPFVAYRYSSDELPGYILQNQLLKAYADNHWSEDNRNLYALWPRLSPYVNDNDDEKSTWFMRDGSFLRLKQVEVGYTFPARYMRRYHLDNLRLYVNGTNLVTFSKFKLWDIEMGGNGLAYPIQKVFNFGVQVGF